MSWQQHQRGDAVTLLSRIKSQRDEVQLEKMLRHTASEASGAVAESVASASNDDGKRSEREPPAMLRLH